MTNKKLIIKLKRRIKKLKSTIDCLEIDIVRIQRRAETIITITDGRDSIASRRMAT